MSKIKKSLSIILAAVMLLSVFIVMPTGAGAAAKKANPITVKKNTCTVDINSLKKADVTVKLLTISKAQGEVTVDFIWSGLSEIGPILDKVSLNRKTGALTLKKGSYKPGTYSVPLQLHAWGNQSYGASYFPAFVTLKIRYSNPITVTAGARKIQQSALKKAAVTIKPLTIAKAQGKVTVTKVKSGTTASIYNYITIDKTNGKITIRKGTYKKGTYAVKLNITAAGNNNYKGKILTRTVKVIIY